MSRTATLILAAGLMTTAALTAAETVHCPATRDVWLSSMGEERNHNMGRAGHIKLKVGQEFGIIDFDVAALRGRRVEQAWLHVKPAGGHKWGLYHGTDLHYLSLATVGHDWVEGESTSYAVDEVGFGATYLESSYSKDDWGWPGANVLEVSIGNCETVRFETELVPAADGWLKAAVDPRLVAALVSGATHGLLVMDKNTGIMVNATIASKDSRHPPFLEVVVGGQDAQVPPAVRGLRAEPAANWASGEHGALVLGFEADADAFSYEIAIDGQAVDRWQIPFAAPGPQGFPLLDLPAEAQVEVSVVAVDAAGNRSPAATVAATVSPAISVPELPASPYAPAAGGPAQLGAAAVWAFPEVTKVHPVSGQVLEEVLPEIRARNAVWDGAQHSVRLAAARGEIVSFQLALEGGIAEVAIELPDLAGPGAIPAAGARLWRNWYMQGQSEYAIPWSGTVSCPQGDNAIEGQTLQAVTVDYHVPLDTPAGTYRGEIALSAGEHALRLPLTVEVYDVQVPETVFFNPELNCYGGPGRAGSEQFKDSYRLAHYHRATINRVPYSQNGNTHQDWIPETDPTTGRVTDWTGFDRNLGGLLDGSWFADNPRAGVPVPTLYLPHYEGYPLDYQQHYDAGTPFASGDRASMTRHQIAAKLPLDALSDAYKRAFVTNVGDFYRHFAERGWTRTMCQMYLNNKGWKGGYAQWCLDEPHKAVDWDALNAWGLLWKQGIDDPAVYTPAWHQEYFLAGGVTAMGRERPTFLYRGDISRSTLQGSMSDGIMTIMYGGNDRRTLRNHRRRMPAILYTYGSASAPERSNWENAAWCLKTYADYRDGVLPWQSLGGPDSLTTGDKPSGGNALIVDSGEHGFGHAVASFRLHAMRRGAQDCELLRLLQLQRGWSREHIEALVVQRVPIRVKHQVTDAASAVGFDSLTSQGFAELKEGVLQMLVAGR